MTSDKNSIVPLGKQLSLIRRPPYNVFANNKFLNYYFIYKHQNQF